MKTCDICGRTNTEAYLESWEMDGITFTACVDTPDCDAIAWGPGSPPPVDQLLRQRGFAELPGMEAS